MTDKRSRTAQRARGEAVAAEPRARTPTVLVFLLMTALAVVPGLWLKFEPDQAMLAGLKASLAPLSWWSGPRFWMGFIGALMIGMMLLYPLRKLVASRRYVGSVGNWFNIHMVLGLAGPVLVLYHAGFGHGGFNATVALWAMLVVTASGVIGYFVYTSASASFYAGKERARAELDQIAAKLSELDAMFAQRRKFIADLDLLEAELLTPRQGIRASIAARLRLEQRRRALAHQLSWLLAECARDLRLAEAEHQRVRRIIGGHFAAYMRFARHAATRSVREQLWARWRLFHLPMFLLMVVAASLHVWAVWDIDDPATAEPASVPATVTPRPAPDGPAVPAPSPAVRPIATPPSAQTTSQTALPATPKAAEPKVTIVQTRSALPSGATAAPPVAAAAAATAPPASASSRVDDGISKLLVEEQRRIAEAPTEPPAPAPAPRRVAPGPTASPATPAPALGPTAGPRTLIEQIADFKARRQLGQFSHSEAETGYELTGKHVAVDCTKCHTTLLKEVRSESPRPCIACHAKDDNHKGRRPSCGNCHLTTSFKDRKPKAK